MIEIVQYKNIISRSYRSILCILGFIITIYCFYRAVRVDTISCPLYLLPYFYTMFMLFTTNNIKNVYDEPGIVTLNIVLFARYLLTPFVIYSFDRYSIFARNYDFINESVALMIYEQWACFITIQITGMKFKKKVVGYEYKNKFKYLHLKNGILVSFLVIFILGLIITLYPSLVSNTFITYKKANSGEIEDISGAITILWSMLYIWLYVYGITKVHELYVKKNLKRRYVFFAIAFTILLILITFLGNKYITRWYTVVTTIASVVFLLKFFNKERKLIIVSIVVPAFIFITLLSIYKNSTYLVGNSNLLKGFFDIFSATTVDSYFAGPVSVNNAIGTKTEYSYLGLHSIIYDLLKSFPVLNHYIDTSGSTVDAYSLYIQRSDQILPLIGQSAIYFGYLLSPILSIFSVIIVRYADYKFKISYSFRSYIYAFIAVWYALIMILNLKINVAWVYARIIPFAFILWVSDRYTNQKIESENNKKVTGYDNKVL